MSSIDLSQNTRNLTGSQGAIKRLATQEDEAIQRRPKHRNESEAADMQGLARQGHLLDGCREYHSSIPA